MLVHQPIPVYPKRFFHPLLLLSSSRAGQSQTAPSQALSQSKIVSPIATKSSSDDATRAFDGIKWEETCSFPNFDRGPSRSALSA
jgi:hypothetical protein